ncbi:MAG: hypothetical protein IJM15_01315 [Erysipelotrichaceae bacterium]|nr:hypothetical protein [Erysipelotrichaceae bacterium]
MKKLLVIMMSMMLILTVSGCTKKTEDPKPDNGDVLLNDPPQEDDGTTYGKYRIWPVVYPDGFFAPDYRDYGEAHYTDFEKAAEAFNKRNDDADSNLAFNKKLKGFYASMIENLLTGNDNNVFSPVNLYFNFTMLASMAQGRSRDELLALFGLDLETLVKNYQSIWNDNTLKGKSTVSFANSIWLNEKLTCKKEAVKEIAEKFYAPVFRGDPTKKEFENAFKDWLNDNTGNLLKREVDNLSFDEQLMVALASTIYYKSNYMDAYVLSEEKDVFHGTDGDKELQMMHKRFDTDYFAEKLFSGYVETLAEEEMLMILPEEGVSFEQLFKDPAFQSIVLEGNRDSMGIADVTVHVPPFDVTSKFNLKDVLKTLGVNGIFGDDIMAFNNFSDVPLCVETMEHACRVKADENGVEAAAYTVELMEATAMYRNEKIEMNFNRPFFFIIRSRLDNTVLFCGVINNA